jgi:hypothetical protein
MGIVSRLKALGKWMDGNGPPRDTASKSAARMPRKTWVNGQSSAAQTLPHKLKAYEGHTHQPSHGRGREPVPLR